MEQVQNEAPPTPTSKELPCWEVSDFHMFSTRIRALGRGWVGPDSPGGVLPLKSRHAYGAQTDAGRKGTHEQAEHNLPGGEQPAMAWLVISTPDVQKRSHRQVLCRPPRHGSREWVTCDIQTDLAATVLVEGTVTCQATKINREESRGSGTEY